MLVAPKVRVAERVSISFFQQVPKDISDLDLVNRLSNGRVDLTYGRYRSFASIVHVGSQNSLSSLDIFGGSLVKFDELVKVSEGSPQSSSQLGDRNP